MSAKCHGIGLALTFELDLVDVGISKVEGAVQNFVHRTLSPS